MPEIIVALDVSSANEIAPLVNALPSEIRWYKVGLEFFTAEGPRALGILQDKNKRIFLDLKLHDIPRTVERAVSAAAQHGVDLLTVHAAGGRAMLEAAARAAKHTGTRLLAITTLTSLDEADLVEMGVQRPLPEHTAALGGMAIQCGIDGLVCSVHEAAAFRTRLGTGPLLVTPGIRLRPASPAADGTPPGQVRPAHGAEDQKRVATPAMAVQAGADYLVVGRPIVQAENPRAAALAMLAEIRDATQSAP